MKMKPLNTDWQLLSAYLDGQLDSSQKEKLETRLHQETALQEALQSLEQTKLLLKHARQVKSPRNFTINQAQAEKLRPKRTFRWVPMLSLSSALATVMMIFAILIELVISPVPLPLANTTQTPASAMLAMEAAPQADSFKSNAPQELPMIIQWGAPEQSDGNRLMATGFGGGEAIAKGSGNVVGMGGAEVVPNPLALLPASTPEQQDEGLKLAANESDGSGLILGLRTSEDAQAYNQVVLDNIDNSLSSQTNRGSASAPYLRWIQLSLALIAVITGAIALSMGRKIQR